MTKVTAVIRCRNEERWIGHSIQSCIDFVPDLEIIIVNDHSTDDSLKIVDMFGFTDIKRIDIDRYTPGLALNAAVTKATGDFTLILSAHCELTRPIWTWPDGEEYLAIWGKQIPLYKGKKITPRYVWANFGDEAKVNYFSQSEQRHFMHNALALFRTQDLLRFPFNEKLAGKEDRYWAIDRINEGRRILYTPELECKHHWSPGGATWQTVG